MRPAVLPTDRPVGATLLLSVCAFLLRFGFSTLLIFTLYNNPAASESDECVCARCADDIIQYTALSDSQAAGLLYNVNISRVRNPNRSRNAQTESSRD